MDNEMVLAFVDRLSAEEAEAVAEAVVLESQGKVGPVPLARWNPVRTWQGT